MVLVHLSINKLWCTSTSYVVSSSLEENIPVQLMFQNQSYTMIIEVLLLNSLIYLYVFVSIEI